MLFVTDPNPEDDPFESNPFADMAGGMEQLNELFRMFGSGGMQIPGVGGAAPSWDSARQVAGALAAQGASEANIDPMVRFQFEQLARVAELQIADVTGLTLSRSGVGLNVVPVTRAQWSAATIDAYRPFFEKLAGSMGSMMSSQIGSLDPEDLEQLSSMLPPGIDIDMSALFGAMSAFIGPTMMMTMAGSVVGQLGSRAFGSFDLPIPRPDGAELLVVGSAIDEFAADWSVPVDDLRLYVCLTEIAHHAVLSLPHVRARMNDLLCRHAAGFEADSAALEAKFGDFDEADPLSIESLQAKMADPTFVLNAIRSDAQREVLTYIDALVACIEGYVDHVVDRVGTKLLGSYPMVSEAMRRRRVETDEASRFVEQLFGLELTRSHIDHGTAFIEGIVSRAGEDALTRLWTDELSLPTPNEVAAPGLWIERVGLGSADSTLPELEGDPQIPDYPDLDA